jgi:hypothetical protein
MKTPGLLIHGICKGGVHHYELAKYQCSWIKKRHYKGPERTVGHAMTGCATCQQMRIARKLPYQMRINCQEEMIFRKRFAHKG